MPVFLLKVVGYSMDATLDGFSNEFVYEPVSSGTIDVPTATALMNGVVKFWNTPGTGAVYQIGGYIQTSIDRVKGLDVHAYDITSHLAVGAIHGPPVASINVTPAWPGGPGTGAMAEGVAGALSYRSDYGTDTEFVRDPTTHKVIARPRANHRGRIWVGPLKGSAFVQDPVTFRTKLTPTFCSDLCFQFKSIQHLTDSSSNVWQMVQWSKKKATVAPLVMCWADDRPDYQRRRADQSTTRYTQTLP
jgi:hypothetical protein